MTSRFATAVLVLAGITSWAAAQDTQATIREWKDASGRYTIHAIFSGIKDGKVQLTKADGTTVTLSLNKLSPEDQQVVQNLASRSDSAHSSTQEGAQELKYDDGQAAGKQSFAGRGHAVRFETPEGKWVLSAVKLHGSRYGFPKPPQEDFLIWVCNEQGDKLAELKIPYKTFKREAEKWVTMNVTPTPVPQKFLLCFDFNAESTKGIYVSYDANPSGNSLVGVPGKEFNPWQKGDWMIRAVINPAKDKPAKKDAEKPATTPTPRR